ncbi:MAG: DNA polymerase III subunit delta [Cyclobacteriaceae bacterium]|nr:DNA polymerase III subunit delta [Cyclobacteriaceae bacterium]
MQSYDEVLKELKSGKYATVYFLQGDEPFFIDQITGYIEKNALDEAAKGFNQVIMYGKDIKMQDILNNARRYPMMSDRQVVIVKEAKDIQDFDKAESQNMFIEYLKNPLPSTILVLAYKYKSLDGRKAIAKSIDKLTVMVEAKKLYENQLPDWIKNHIKSIGYDINEKAVRMLVDNIGNNLERIHNEVSKMLINLKDKKTIDEHDIQEYIGISKDYNPFELQKALAVKDVFKANQIVNYFEANPKNNPIIPLIALLFSYYVKLLQVLELPDTSEKSIARDLKLNFFASKEYAIAAKNYPKARVIQIIHYLREADLRLKGVDGNMEDGQILRELIFKILH